MIISAVEIDELVKDGRIIIYNKHIVYDITDYLELHPGGRKCLLKKKGKNCERDFNFHSSSAQPLWDTYVIGKRYNTIWDHIVELFSPATK